MEKKIAQQKYKELIASIRILASRAIGEDKKAVYSRLSRLAKYLEEVNSQRHLCMLSETDRIEKVRYNELLEYIDVQYDGTEESVKKICRVLNKRENIYQEVIASIRILAIRTIGENKKEDYDKLSRVINYLEEVKAQRHLCMLSETDRIEKVRYKEVLDYIDMQYDGTEESVRTICEELCEREDIDEVLKYHDKKNKLSKEEER